MQRRNFRKYQRQIAGLLPYGNHLAEDRRERLGIEVAGVAGDGAGAVTEHRSAAGLPHRLLAAHLPPDPVSSDTRWRDDGLVRAFRPAMPLDPSTLEQLQTTVRRFVRERLVPLEAQAD